MIDYIIITYKYKDLKSVRMRLTQVKAWVEVQ